MAGTETLSTTVETAEERADRLQTELNELRAKRSEERRKTVEITQRYARQHRLCEVVDQALTEAGYLGGNVVTKEIEVNVTAKITVALDMDQLEGKTEEEMKELFRSQAQLSPLNWARLGLPVSISSLANGRMQTTTPTTQVEAIELVSITDAPDASLRRGQVVPGGQDATQLDAPVGWLARYASAEGRAAHFYVRDDVERSRLATAMCAGQATNTRRYLLTTPRAEHRVCATCVERAMIRYGYMAPR